MYKPIGNWHVTTLEFWDSIAANQGDPANEGVGRARALFGLAAERLPDAVAIHDAAELDD